MKAFRYMLMAAAFIASSAALSQPLPALVPVATGFDHPVCITSSGDARLFIIQQPGIIKILDSTGSVLPTLFLDITGRVVYGGERGLLGLAFHPLYLSNGYFYVDYVGAGDSTHISRFSVSSFDPNVADPGSEMKMLTIYQPYQNHKGGQLQFGPDGYLYIGMGDGGSAGDPGNRAQDSLELLGKILRIDVDGGLPYTIPPTNPFVGNPHARAEIWALGLRNPWRFSFDRINGDLWIGDVGQDLWEEVDYQPVGSVGGKNLGWRCYEGFAVYDTSGCHPAADMTFPVHVYEHSTQNGCCIVGGYRYRGTLFPNLLARYFFADYCSDNIWSLYDSAGGWGTVFHGKFGGNSFSTFGEDNKGELYIAGLVSGTIYHIIDSGAQSVAMIGSGSFSVFPNPVSNRLQIRNNGKVDLTMQIRIASLEGITVYSSISAGSETAIDMGFLAPGLYILEIRTNEGTGIIKLVRK